MVAAPSRPAPLLLVFLGFAGVARERESGTLRTLSAHGAGGAAILGGKVIALAAVALPALLPALVALGWAAVRDSGESGIAALTALGYGLYLLVWVIGIVAVSALSRRAQGSLVTLITLWAIIVVLVPRAAAGWAGIATPLPSRVDTEFAIAADLRRMGDAHNPDDPHFAAFKARLLKQYRVTRTEDLPFNYRGVLGQEGERLTARLFKDYAGRADAIQLAQSAQMAALGLLSPALAVRRISMVGAATDLGTHLAFMADAERYRYAMVQRLNGLQASAVSSADDAARSKDPFADRRTRISADFWKTIPDFHFAPPDAGDRAAVMLPAVRQLLLWILAALVLLGFAARRLSGPGL